MTRLIIFLLVILALGLGFAWLADKPGELSILWEGQLVEMSLTVAATIIVALVAAIMICWWLVRTVWNSPHSVRRYFRARTRDRGYQALSTGLIAAGAGNAVLARKMSVRARGLLRADQEPLILLLEAQAAQIEGRPDEARRLFQQMSEDPETRELGLRGLYVEASRLGANEAARQYAETATEHAPYLSWAAKATLEYRCQAGHWDDAIRLLDQQRIAHVLTRAEADRLKAVLLTAKAKEELDGEPTKARDHALSAHKLARDLVPAAVIAAKAYMREDNVRKASSVLEQTWKLTPHPEIAAAYVRARPGDSAVDRLKRAEKLEGYKPNNPEALFAVAEAALAATDFPKARAKCEAILRMAPTERVYLLLADIEEAETGDQGRIRHWMGAALRAPRDPTWVADGQVSDDWLPVSPVTGRLDAFEWKSPFSQLSAALEHESGDVEHTLKSLPPLAAPTPVSRPEPTPAPTPAAAAPAPQIVTPITPAAPVEQPKDVAEMAEAPKPVEPPLAGTEVTTTEPEKAQGARDKTVEPFFGRAPDDPGVRDPDRVEQTKTRLQLF